MDVKVACHCGQNYQFEVEPVNGRMPMPIGCPSCGADGTVAANGIIAQQVTGAGMSAPVEPSPAPPSGAGLRVSRITLPPTAVTPPPLAEMPAPRPAVRPLANAVAGPKKSAAEFNLGLGILGAILGAGVGLGLMYAFFSLTGFRFPLLGTGIGALTGLGARMLYKGTDLTLGVIAGSVALLATAGALYLMFGEIQAMYILSMIVSVSIAYKIAG